VGGCGTLEVVPPAPHLLIAGLGIAAAGLVSGLTGFGFALVSVPLLLLVFQPATVVVIVLTLGLVTSGINALTSRRHVDARRLAVLLPPALLGMVAGSFVLRWLDPLGLKLTAALLVIVFTVALSRMRRTFPGAPWQLTAAAGALSGAMATSIGLAGPPVVLLTSAIASDKHVIRATLAAFFAVTAPIGVSILALQGDVQPHALVAAAALAPVAMLGRFAGSRLLLHTPSRTYRQLTLLITLVTGLAGAATAVSALIAHR